MWSRNTEDSVERKSDSSQIIRNIVLVFYFFVPKTELRGKKTSQLDRILFIFQA